MSRSLLMLALLMFSAASISSVRGAGMPDDVRKHIDKHIIGNWKNTIEFDGKTTLQTGTASWSPAKNAVFTEYIGADEDGPFTISECIGWDDARKAVVSTGFASNGDRWTISYDKRSGGTWTGTGTGLWNGKDWKSDVQIVWSEDGHRYTDTTEGKPFVITASRQQIQSEAIPDDARKALSFFVGQWKSETFLNGKKIGQDTETRDWLPGEYGLLMRSSGQEDGGNLNTAGISGWDAKGKQLVERWYSSEGLAATVRYPLSGMTKDSWKGDFTVTFGDGSSYDGECTLHVEDHAAWTWVANWEQDGQKMERRSITRKVN